MRQDLMRKFVYFAYGSNMLTTRMRERCPSAIPMGRAAPGYGLTFDKVGRDGSGKATIGLASSDERVEGVLFNIREADLPALDKAEGGYVRHDRFPVLPEGSSAPLAAVTYIAPPQNCRDGLCPFDWYLELIRAGLRENGFPEEYANRLSRIRAIEDGDRDRSERMFGLCAMKL